MATQTELHDAFDRCLRKIADFKRDVASLVAALDASWNAIDQNDVAYKRLADAADDVRRWLTP
jgi:hypothetical protein